MCKPCKEKNGEKTEKTQGRSKGRVTKSGKVIRKSVVGGKHQLTDRQMDAFQRHYGKTIKDRVGTNIITM